ncbi:MAG: hypothetical protein SGILL_005629, partial [Bacillariaceae sp.]
QIKATTLENLVGADSGRPAPAEDDNNPAPVENNSADTSDDETEDADTSDDETEEEWVEIKGLLYCLNSKEETLCVSQDTKDNVIFDPSFPLAFENHAYARCFEQNVRESEVKHCILFGDYTINNESNPDSFKIVSKYITLVIMKYDGVQGKVNYIKTVWRTKGRGSSNPPPRDHSDFHFWNLSKVHYELSETRYELSEARYELSETREQHTEAQEWCELVEHAADFFANSEVVEELLPLAVPAGTGVPDFRSF